MKTRACDTRMEAAQRRQEVLLMRCTGEEAIAVGRARARTSRLYFTTYASREVIDGVATVTCV